MRLFLSLPVDADLGRPTAMLATLPDFRPVPEGSWHLTLRFFQDARPEDVHRAMDGFTAPALTGRFLTAGAFPTPAKATVAWLGLDAAGLGAVVQEVRDRTTLLGGDDQAFRAHVSLGRFRRPTDVRILLRRVEVPSQPVSLDRVDLMASELGPDRPQYTCLASWPLQAGSR